jgi:hypothetical protein
MPIFSFSCWTLCWTFYWTNFSPNTVRSRFNEREAQPADPNRHFRPSSLNLASMSPFAKRMEHISIALRPRSRQFECLASVQRAGEDGAAAGRHRRNRFAGSTKRGRPFNHSQVIGYGIRPHAAGGGYDWNLRHHNADRQASSCTGPVDHDADRTGQSIPGHSNGQLRLAGLRQLASGSELR